MNNLNLEDLKIYHEIESLSLFYSFLKDEISEKDFLESFQKNNENLFEILSKKLEFYEKFTKISENFQNLKI